MVKVFPDHLPVKNGAGARLLSEKLKKTHLYIASTAVAIVSLAVLLIFCLCRKRYLAKPEFELEAASVFDLRFAPVSSPLNLTVGYNITGDWKLDFGVRNPNKNYVVTYSDMNVAVEYSWLGLRWDGYRIQGFHDQDSHAVLVHATPPENPRFPFVEDGDRMGIVGKWISKHGSRWTRTPESVDFKVRLRGVVMQKAAGGAAGNEEEKWRKLDVDCDLKDVGVEITAAGVSVTAATPSHCGTSVQWRWSWVVDVNMFVSTSFLICGMILMGIVEG